MPELLESEGMMLYLVDDGTMDTVIACGSCDWRGRYNPEPTGMDDESDDGWRVRAAVEMAGEEHDTTFHAGFDLDTPEPTPQRGDSTEPWDRDEIQFPRLLAEIRAYGLSGGQYAGIGESMGLSSQEIDSLLERAENEWERIKASDPKCY